MIHKYKMNDLNIVIDVNSGGIHIVDDLVYEILDYCEDNPKDKAVELLHTKYEKDELLEALDEIYTLKNEQKLFSPSNSEKIAPIVNSRAPVVKALCLHIAHDCNLKCKYCFAEEGEYHGSRSFMSAEVGKKSLDFLAANSGNRVNLEVDFFGGEPLMNFDVVKEIVDYGKELEKKVNKKFRFTMTTNGVLLDEEKINYINENMYNCVLSIDGRREVNDKMRKTMNGGSSYDIILPKFKEIAKKRNQSNYYVRGTFTRDNLDFGKDVLHLYNEGFKQISVEPVVAGPEDDYSLREEDLPTIFEEYENLAKEMLKLRMEGHDFNFFHFMIDLEGGPCISKRLVGCGAGSEYLAVTPEGDLFPCHQFVGDPDFLMGTVFTGVVNDSKTKEFENCNVLTKPECNDCWAKFYCSGGCAANAYQNTNDILSPYTIGCEIQKKRSECAIMMKAYEIINKG